MATETLQILCKEGNAVGVINSSHSRIMVTLRIGSKTRTVAEISKLLRTVPTRSVEKNELLSPRSPNSARAQDFLWFLQAPYSANESAEKHFAFILSFLELHEDALRLIAQDAYMDIWVFVSSKSGRAELLIDHQRIMAISRLPVDIVFDLYPPQK